MFPIIFFFYYDCSYIFLFFMRSRLFNNISFCLFLGGRIKHKIRMEKVYRISSY